MRRPLKLLSELANNPWFVVAGGVCSIVAFLAYIYEKFDPRFSFLPSVGLGLSLIALLAGYFYSIRVRVENIALRDLSKYFYEINRIYKKKLEECFVGEDPMMDAADLLAIEEAVLRSVCQRIENIFSRAIRRQCMVTVKLVREIEGTTFAQTYVRSQESSPRDESGRACFDIHTGANTALDFALVASGNGRPAHYYSPNLLVEENYSNQRQHWSEFYRSVLVVPIRSERFGEGAAPVSANLLGYLIVDTLSTNRLNNSNHLYMLAALAQQAYNFMALMRGTYTVFVEN